MSQKLTKLNDQNFAQWYKSVDMEADAVRCQNRLKGINQLISDIKRQDFEALLRIIYRIPGVVQPDNKPAIREVFKKFDETFDEENDREMEILSASALAILMQKSTSNAAAAALAVLTSYLEGARNFNVPMNITELAYSCVGNLAEENRKRPDSSRLRIASAKLDPSIAKSKLPAPPAAIEVTAIQAAIDELTKTFQKALDGTASAAQDAVVLLVNFGQVQDEELQMLWWLFAEHSFERERPFSLLSSEEKTIVLPYELSSHTTVIPGRPNSIENILARAGLASTKKITIPQAVNSCDLDWLSKIRNPPGFPVTTPIHYAIQRRLETRDTTGWLAGWSAVTGITQEHEISQLELGTLFYFESLLIRILAN